MELLLLYFWLKLDTLIAMGTLATVGIGAALLARLGWCYIPYYEDETSSRLQKSKGLWSKGVVAVVFVGALTAAIPTRTDTAILIGGHYALKVANTPESAKIMSVLRKKANEILDKELEK